LLRVAENDMMMMLDTAALAKDTAAAAFAKDAAVTASRHDASTAATSQPLLSQCGLRCCCTACGGNPVTFLLVVHAVAACQV
jgi:hypothetical protein